MLEAVDGKLISDLCGKSKIFSETQIHEKLIATMDKDGKINVENIANPSRIHIVLTPEKALEKIQGMRNFKHEFLRNVEGFSSENQQEVGDVKIAKARIVKLYKDRVNELITQLFPHAVRVKTMVDLIGSEQLTLEEQTLVKTFPGMQEFVKNFSRYDKLVHGASSESDANGDKLQVGSELEEYADQMEERYLENEREKRANAMEKGIDIDKLTKERNIKKETFAKYAEKFLDEYGMKSDEPSETYNPKRSGPASDGKWQFVPRDGFANMKVEGKFKIIKASSKDRSMEDLIAILLAHEFTHFVQALNREKLPLRLYHKVAGDRNIILEEGGAMLMQNMVTEEFFGYKTFPVVHYVRAMIESQKGGSYADCVKAYYESALKAMQCDEGFMQGAEEKIRDRKEKLLLTAIKSTKRLFADDFDSDTSKLTSSKDTVYLEQFVVMKKLKENGMEKYAFILGLNLNSMAELMELGFLDDKKIEKLDMDFIRNVWTQEKSGYLLSPEKLDEVNQSQKV
jgi:hypothetical protein